MSGSARKPRGVEAAILALDCTPEARARLMAKLEKLRETMSRALEAAERRRIQPVRPDGWIPIGEVSQRLREAIEEVRHDPGMSVEEALAMFDAFDNTKH